MCFLNAILRCFKGNASSQLATIQWAPSLSVAELGTAQLQLFTYISKNFSLLIFVTSPYVLGILSLTFIVSQFYTSKEPVNAKQDSLSFSSSAIYKRRPCAAMRKNSQDQEIHLHFWVKATNLHRCNRSLDLYLKDCAIAINDKHRAELGLQ